MEGIEKELENTKIKLGHKTLYCAYCQSELYLPLVYSETATAIFYIDENLDFSLKDVISEVGDGVICCPSCGSVLFDYDEEKVKKIIKFLSENKGGE
ncbi:MAG: hypothetical protein ABIK75_05790 [candidate division WOR-3 bacterium]